MPHPEESLRIALKLDTNALKENSHGHELQYQVIDNETRRNLGIMFMPPPVIAVAQGVQSRPQLLLSLRVGDQEERLQKKPQQQQWAKAFGVGSLDRGFLFGQRIPSSVAVFFCPFPLQISCIHSSCTGVPC